MSHPASFCESFAAIDIPNEKGLRRSVARRPGEAVIDRDLKFGELWVWRKATKGSSSRKKLFPMDGNNRDYAGG